MLYGPALAVFAKLLAAPDAVRWARSELAGLALGHARSGVRVPLPTRTAFRTAAPGQPEPTLLHGDAQHHNFVSTSSAAVVIDATPYYGHPELDLALVDYFSPVPAELFEAYAESGTLDPGFAGRRELWRIFAYRGVLVVDGDKPWGRTFARRLSKALAQYG